jgi:hypothetical protein
VDVGADDDALGDAEHELADARGRGLRRYALLVAARRAVAEANGPEAVDVDDDVLLEALDECAQLAGVLLLHPARVPGVLGALDDRPIGVSSDEPGRVDRIGEPVRLDRLRAPRQIAAEDDEVGLLALELGQHG